MRNLVILGKFRWWPLLVGGSVLVAVVGLLWWLQQKNVDSLDSDIDALKKQINNLQTTVTQREQLNQQIGSLKQQINGLPDKVAPKQLNSQVDELKKQIDTLPDQITSKEQITLQKDRLVLEKDRVNAQNAIYATLVQAVGGAFFFITAYFTYRNLKATEANVKATEEKQVTERFSKAVEQLGNDNIHVRLGGIYALERIANDSDKDYWQVIEVLTAYIREKAPFPLIKKNEGVPFQLHSTKPVEEQKKDIPPIPTDIQAVLTVLTRRRYTFEKGEEHPLDLRKTNLQQADLREANLQQADLREAILKNVIGLDSAVGLTRKQISQIDRDQSNIDEAMLPDYLRAPKSSQPQPPDP